MNTLKPLVWNDITFAVEPLYDAQGAGIFYRIKHQEKGVKVNWVDSIGGSDGHKDFKSIDEAKCWVDTDHYPHKMQPYVNQDSITRTESWFKAAKPEPNVNDLMTQVGCHLEEVCEMLDATGDLGEQQELQRLADWYKNESFGGDIPNRRGNIDILDSLCDQIVTAVGVGYMMGFDMQGALNEVIRSNDSKMVNGRFIFDENSKIAKPDSYSKPDLTPFLRTMPNNKGD